MSGQGLVCYTRDLVLVAEEEYGKIGLFRSKATPILNNRQSNSYNACR